MKTKDIYFFTTNPQKIKDFTAMGFSVMKNYNEPIEILSPYSAEVALHKSKDTGINNVVVEDTSLKIEDAPFLGTQIKDYWKTISLDQNYHGKKAYWEISVCLCTNDHFIISTGLTEGIIKFPRIEDAYNFNKVFAIQCDLKGEKFIHFDLLSPEDKIINSPRNKAVNQLKNAVFNNDFSLVTVIEKSKVPEWKGLYQLDDVVPILNKTKNLKMR